MPGTGGFRCPKCGLIFPEEDGPVCQLCGAEVVPIALVNEWGGPHTPLPDRDWFTRRWPPPERPEDEFTRRKRP